MKILKISRAFRLPAAFVALACLCAAAVSGGESIQFSNARTRTDPTAKSKLPLGTRDDLGGGSPLDYIPPTVERSDPRADRRARNAEAERKNWMLLNRGQLDAEDEERNARGFRDSGKGKAQDPDKKDYFFTPREESDGSLSRSRAQFVRPSGRDATTAQAKEAARDDAKENGEDAQRTAAGKDGQTPGENISKEPMDLKDLLSPGKANSLAPTTDKTTLMWRDMFGGGSVENRSETLRRRDEPSTADSYRGSVSPGASRASESFMFRKDFNTRPAASLTPGLSDSASRSFSAPTAPAAPRAPETGPSRGFNYGGASPAASAFNSQPGSAAADPYSGSRNSSQPQRGAAGSYQIPSRPGYGGR